MSFSSHREGSIDGCDEKDTFDSEKEIFIIDNSECESNAAFSRYLYFSLYSFLFVFVFFVYEFVYVLIFVFVFLHHRQLWVGVKRGVPQGGGGSPDCRAFQRGDEEVQSSSVDRCPHCPCCHRCHRCPVHLYPPRWSGERVEGRRPGCERLDFGRLGSRLGRSWRELWDAKLIDID